MFDTFEPFKKLKKKTFTFSPKRYEIWLEGKLVKSGNSELPIYFTVITQDGEETYRITVYDNLLFDQIANQFILDEFITSNDRLQIVTLPAETNTNCMGILGLKMAIGATRHKKDFATNEPYCCNLFFQDSEPVKVTFSFSKPEKLIEFYN
ncbi:hypothetical protein [Rufibacter sp. LB8]|uniref:hypothetical protein n=1 Tax=Rufibacter sp. LB8 TaxID=2777781 RepID=UPI00178C4E2C|nr:hypothetical protein [Rufibacter sp. LB8]